MNNLKELMKNADKLKYSKKDKVKIQKEACDILGVKTTIIFDMEEISELIEVISTNVNDKFNYIHTTEEIVDVLISMDFLTILFDVRSSKLKTFNKKKIKKKKSVIFNSISVLSKSQQVLSKYSRGKIDDIEKLIDTINSVHEVITDLKVLFNIKEKDIRKIEALKYQRLEERIKDGKLL